MLEAYVVLLPKPGKDPTHCTSYRPMHLIADPKILMNGLVTLLSMVIPALVDNNQTGFMPGKSTDTNLRCLFTLLSHNVLGRWCVWMWPRPFDLLDWAFMHVGFERMGFVL